METEKWGGWATMRRAAWGSRRRKVVTVILAPIAAFIVFVATIMLLAVALLSMPDDTPTAPTTPAPLTGDAPWTQACYDSVMAKYRVYPPSVEFNILMDECTGGK